jgi:hypothetical protein
LASHENKVTLSILVLGALEETLISLVIEYIVRFNIQRGVFAKMLSRDCDGCSRMMLECKQRFGKVNVGEKVFCPDGTAHLVDS